MTEEKKPGAGEAAHGPEDASFDNAASYNKSAAGPQGPEGIRQLGDAANGVFEFCLVRPPDLREFFSAALSGDLDEAAQLVSAVGRFMAQLGSHTLCFCCDTRFGPSIRPEAFAIARPFADRSGMVVAGLCKTCLQRRDVRDRVREHFRRLWPTSLTIGEGGRS